MRLIGIILPFLLALLSEQALPAMQEKYALVIGNSSYNTGPLDNPVNDATDIANRLEALGFNVSRLLNAKQREIDRATRTFSKQLSGENKVGLFYFAGHGIEYLGRNYLIPIDAQIEDEADLKYSAVDAGQVLDKMELAGNGLNMVILDACRNNPFPRSFRSSTQGLAKMVAPKGSLLMYATSPGDVAADGDGRNGVFTQHFLSALAQPGLKPYEVFTKTASGVIRETHDKQRPYIEGYITGTFYFLPGSSITFQQTNNSSQDSENRLSTDIEFWKSVESVGLKKSYLAYLKKFPNGTFSSLAKQKISSIEAGESLTNSKTVSQEKYKNTDESEIPDDNMLSVFSGKTVEGYHNKKAFSFTRYYDPDGTLIGVSDKKGKRKGKWKIKPGILCEIFNRDNFESKDCKKIVKEGSFIMKYNSKGNNVVTYKKFTEGNNL